MRKVFAFFAALAATLLLGSAASAAEAAWGKVKGVTAEKNQFVLMDTSGKERLFTLIEGGKINREGRDAKIADLKAGDMVAVCYVTINKGLYAVDVLQRDDKALPRMTGTIVTTRTGNQLVVNADGKETLVTLADNGVVNTAAKENDSFSSLKAGDKVTVKYVKLPDGGIYAACIEPTR